MDRAEHVRARLTDVRHALQDLSDDLASWGVGSGNALTVASALKDAGTAVDAALDAATAEAVAFPEPSAERRGGFIVTNSGHRFWPLDPRPEDVDLADIAHALGHLCRFAGHTNRLYTVAEHSLNVGEFAARLARDKGYDETLCRWYGLLHDGEEAYLTDVPRPIKRHLRGWDGWAQAVSESIWTHVGLGVPPAEVVEVVGWADNLALYLESRELFGFEYELEWLPVLPIDVDPDAFSLLPCPGDPGLVLYTRLFDIKTECIRAEAARDPAPEPSTSGESWRDESAPTLAGAAGRECPVCGSPAVGEFGLCDGCAPF